MTPSRFWSSAEWACKTARSIIRGHGAPVLPGPLDDGDLLARMEEEQEVWEPPRCGEPTGRCSNRCLRAAGHPGEHDDDPPTCSCFGQYTYGCQFHDAVFHGEPSPTPWWVERTVEAKATKTEQPHGEWMFTADEQDLLGLKPGDMLGGAVVGEPQSPADVAGATSDPADRGTPPRGAVEAPRGADSPVVLPAEFDTPTGLAALLRFYGLRVEFKPSEK